MEAAPPQLSILIPTVDEEAWIGPCVQAVRASLAYGEVSGEIILCDGGSRDGTVEEARRVGADRIVTSAPGRAAQLGRGAERATGRGLVFLHADTLVAPDWAGRIERVLREGAVGGWFEVEILPEQGSLTANGLRCIAEGINWRTRRFRTATGDQSLFVRRDVFEAIGGFADLPILEGADLAARLRRRGDVAVLEPRLRISGRRWERAGLIRGTLAMYAVRVGYHCGVAPARLRRIWEWSTGA